MTVRLWLPSLALAIIGTTTARAQEGTTPADSVHLVGEQTAKGPEVFEWLYSLDCRAGGVEPSLRVGLSQMTGHSASGGVAMRVDAEDRAVGTLRLRIALVDKAAGTYTVTAELGPSGPTFLGQTLRLEPGKELAAVADLRSLPATHPFRRAIFLGTVGGCMVTAHVMPGRSKANLSPAAAPPPGDPAVEAVRVFRLWVRGVKAGDLEQFAAGLRPAEWSRLSGQQRSQRLQEYQDSFRTVLGADFDPDLFKVEYAGGPTSGKLEVRYADKELPALNVRFVNGTWVLSEP